MNTTQTTPAPEGTLDVLVIGAGISGIYQLYRLTMTDLSVAVVEAGEGVGGTWYWNRYPGARFDSESYTYAYFFSKELREEWSWSEHFAGQPEIERYLNHVVDRFDLRKYITFDTRVSAMDFDEDTSTWWVTTANGDLIHARFVITGVGMLSAPQFPAVPGIEDFRGISAHTGLWPQAGIDFAGKKVAVIGTGSSGVQVISEIADAVDSLTIYQRTPNWCSPLNNAPITDEEQEQIKSDMDQMHETLKGSFAGFAHSFAPVEAGSVSRAERLEFWEQLYKTPGFSKLLGNYLQVMTDKTYNREFSDFLEGKIRNRVQDPAVADLLVPDHGYGAKRPPFETNYYEVYNRPNVNLVDLRTTPITRITETGLETTAGAEDFDVIIYATGFDAITGAYDRIDITAGGASLKAEWKNGPFTFAGAAAPGFPNLFFLVGPHSSGGNVPRMSERQVDFVTGVLGEAVRRGASRVEATREAAQEWTDHVYELNSASLAAEEKIDYTYGTNTPGKKIVFRHYDGGLIGLNTKLTAVEDTSYAGYEFR
ncbi:flavin-containing monooxygenase [Nocardia sp. R16R-3T]